VNFILLLAVFGGLAFKLTSPADRARYLGVATDFLRQLKGAAQRPRPEYESFRDALRARTRDLFVTPALLTLNAAVFTAMLFGSGAIGDPDTLLGMGANIGTRTTNGEWWRLLTSAFVHIGTFHLIVNLAVLAQVGAVLERLVGRLAFGAVYLAAGVFTALVNISSHPVEVTVGATGAIFGLYGLLLASVIWQTLNQIMRPLLAQIAGRLRRRAGQAETGADESGDPDLTSGDPGLLIPAIALKRLGYGAGLFILLSAMSGLATSAEFTGLIVGLGYGLVVARRAGYESPAPRPVGAVLAAAVVLAAAWAIPLRNIANVRPEITRVVATEERTAATYQAASDAFRKGRISAEALAQLADRKILPELQAVEARLTALKNVPSEHQPLVTDAREYLRLRSKAWRLKADAIRKANTDPLQGSDRSMDASWRLQAQERFRTNQLAMGNAEGAERASLEAFRRVKGATPPPDPVLAEAR
jgi:membrane associated rhomboid family serine protease